MPGSHGSWGRPDKSEDKRARSSCPRIGRQNRLSQHVKCQVRCLPRCNQNVSQTFLVPFSGVPAWCHSCDELAGKLCPALKHSITPLSSGLKEEAQLSQNQMNKIQLNLSYALGRRMEIDSYLKSIKQSISILDKHVVQLKDANAHQINLIEGPDHWLIHAVLDL